MVVKKFQILLLKWKKIEWLLNIPWLLDIHHDTLAVLVDSILWLMGYIELLNFSQFPKAFELYWEENEGDDQLKQLSIDSTKEGRRTRRPRHGNDRFQALDESMVKGKLFSTTMVG